MPISGQFSIPAPPKWFAYAMLIGPFGTSLPFPLHFSWVNLQVGAGTLWRSFRERRIEGIKSCSLRDFSANSMLVSTTTASSTYAAYSAATRGTAYHFRLFPVPFSKQPLSQKNGAKQCPRKEHPCFDAGGEAGS